MYTVIIMYIVYIDNFYVGYPYDCFPQGLMYIHVYIHVHVYMFGSLACVVYVVKKVASFRGLGQLMGVACKSTHTRATDQQEECKTSTNTNTCSCCV